MYISVYFTHVSIQNLQSYTLVKSNVLLGLARLGVVNSYARTPPLVWKMGWMPSPVTGRHSTHLPPLPLDFLQERDVLRDFIFRVNTIGKREFLNFYVGLFTCTVEPR